jgi:probable HAF family extracellular repeat protein
MISHHVRLRVAGLLPAVALLLATAPPSTAAPATPAGGAPHDTAAVRYTITDLGTLGGSFVAPLDLNDRGEVVGVADRGDNAGIRGFVWKRGLMSDLGSLGGPQTAASAINASGQIAGWSQLKRTAPKSIFNTTSLFCDTPAQPTSPRFVCRAFLRTHGRLLDLGTLGGANSAAENKAMNDRGDVVGVAETRQPDPTAGGKPRFHAFLSRSGAARLLDLGTLGRDPDSFALGVNNRREVTGVSVANGSTFTGGTGRGFVWRRGHKIELPRLGGHFSSPGSINDRGTIVGWSTLAGDRTRHAALWSHGRVLDLGTLPGDVSSEAADITDRGLVVGTSCGANGCRAVQWRCRASADLNARIGDSGPWELTDTQAVNRRGQIVGDAAHAGLPRGFLLTPARR